MHLPINVKFPNNISKWQMEFNSAFKGLSRHQKGIPQGCSELLDKWPSVAKIYLYLSMPS
jgi:hypothetical protein